MNDKEMLDRALIVLDKLTTVTSGKEDDIPIAYIMKWEEKRRLYHGSPEEYVQRYICRECIATGIGSTHSIKHMDGCAVGKAHAILKTVRNDK